VLLNAAEQLIDSRALLAKGLLIVTFFVAGGDPIAM
jgi:hypothetical protein